MTSAVRVLARDLLALVLPVACPGCGTPGETWCPGCRRALTGPPWRCEDRAGRLDRLDGRPTPVWTLADNVGPVRAAVVAWKDGGRSDLGPPLCAALASAARTVAPLVGPRRAGPLLVVPVPSTPAARRRRGGWLVDDLARGVVDGARLAGVDALRAPVLRRRRGADQVGLGARDRARNLAGQVRVPARARPRLAGRDVLLVDDVLTTGASLAACLAVVESAGGRVVGCLTLASTPSPGSVRPRGGPFPPRSSGLPSTARRVIGGTAPTGVSVGA